jgi:hypothetical protein
VRRSGELQAFYLMTTDGAQRGGGGIPLGERRVGTFCQHSPFNIGVIVTVKAQQVQRALQRRQRRVEGGIFGIATAENLSATTQNGYASR